MKALILSLAVLISVSAQAEKNCSRICQGGHLTASAKVLLKKSFVEYVSAAGAHVLFSSEPVKGCALKEVNSNTLYHLCVLEGSGVDSDMAGHAILRNMEKNFGQGQCTPEIYRSTMGWVLSNLLSGNYDAHTGRKLEPTVGQVYETLEWATDSWTCGQK